MLVTIEQTQQDLDNFKKSLEYFQEHHPESVEWLTESSQHVWHDVGILETTDCNPEHIFEVLDLRNNVVYGVCDNYSQVVKHHADILQSDDKYVVHLVCIAKKNEPETGGWRWHKWGEYIGVHERTTEYIHDEPYIDRVYLYCIYKIVDNT